VDFISTLFNIALEELFNTNIRRKSIWQKRKQLVKKQLKKLLVRKQLKRKLLRNKMGKKKNRGTYIP